MLRSLISLCHTQAKKHKHERVFLKSVTSIPFLVFSRRCWIFCRDFFPVKHMCGTIICYVMRDLICYKPLSSKWYKMISCCALSPFLVLLSGLILIFSSNICDKTDLSNVRYSLWDQSHFQITCLVPGGGTVYILITPWLLWQHY